MIKPVKGTRDYYPENMAFRTWLHGAIRQVSESFGYQEYEAPFLERLELYAAKSGDELVREQAYVFEDRGGEQIVLRPELTPSLARMVAALGRNLQPPIRWWSFGPFWRYEKPQRGRSREFFQWNIDLLGVDSAQADAEIVAVLAAFFEKLNLNSDQVRIFINNRHLMESQLNRAGFPAAQYSQIFRYIDRKDKMGIQKWQEYGQKLGFDPNEVNRIKSILAREEAWADSEELSAFFAAADALNISKYLQYDPTVIRGLDYYTGTVFEARDIGASERAILGGGRYDNLVAEVGGQSLPGVGFAMGDVVLRLVLENYSLLPELQVNPSDILVIYFEENLRNETLSLAAKLRAAGIKAEWYPEPHRLNRQFKYADRQGIPFALILGPDEAKNGIVALKNLKSGEQDQINQDDLIEHLRRSLERATT
ncbi:MAG: histidine--tRNA ligase [Chloroflexi bacterium]|nr:histidine--tRNA ligase [Chloroflexota bacterium]